MTACLLGHEKKVKYLLKNQDNIAAIDHFGMNAFLDTVISQSNPILELLILNGADVNHINQHGDNALLIAVQQQNPNQKLIKTLLENQVDSTIKNIKGQSAFSVAEKKHPIIYKLMEKKIEAEKQIELPLFAASNVIESAQPKLTKEIDKANHISDSNEPRNIPNNANQQLWFEAITNGNLGRLNQLKVKGIGIDLTDNKGCTGLIHAAGKGHRAVASYLIQNNANIEHRSHNGSTPMSSAIISNSRALVGLLIANGAEVNGLGPGNYPYLSLAATQWSEACVSMLLDANADINTTDEAGMSLYHHVAIAAEYYSNTAKAKNTLRLIHQYGLDINIQNQQGNTALHLICGAMKQKKYNVDDSHIANITHDILKLGANPKITNNSGFTAIQYAKQHGLLNTNGVLLSFLDVW
jgi:ankyrin repeat protein